MEYFELIRQRGSIRAYKPDPVEDEKLEQVLEAARLAPTAANRQPFKLIVARTASRQAQLARVYGREWFRQAPLVICACALPDKAWVRGLDEKNYADVDVAIVMDHLILAAANLGLGTCWVAHFDPQAVAEVFCLPPGLTPVVLTPLGYPDGLPRPKERRPLSDLVEFI